MFWPSLDVDSKQQRWLKKQPFAHRGLHDAAAGIPENSFAAFDRAIAAGYGIELDIQLTRDGDIVVFHDATLDRMTDAKGPVIGRSREDIRQLRLAGTTETIHTLHDTLIRVRGRVPVLIEAKTPSPADFAPVCFAIRRALEGYKGACAVMSFNHELVGWFYRHHPKVQRGLVMTEVESHRKPMSRYDLRRRIRRQLDIWRAHPQFLAYDVDKLPSPVVDGAKESRRPVLAWTVRTQEQLLRARSHCDQFIFEGAMSVAQA